MTSRLQTTLSGWKNVLITGGAGFIGSNLVKRCIDEGFGVTVVDDMSNGHLEFLGEKRPDAVFGFDFTHDLVIDAIKQQRYDAVVHLAAMPRVGYSVIHPVESNDTNVSKTLKLLDACKGNTHRMVFASSCSVYGTAKNLPTTEDEPKDPQSPYALQKLIIEDYLKLYHNLYGLDSVALRFFNVFGPNQLGDSPYSTAVSAWLTAIKEGKGVRSDGDGEQTRDLVYVDNVVDALFRSIVHPEPLGAQPLNVGTGKSISNNEILKLLHNSKNLRSLLKNPNIAVIKAPTRLGDVRHTKANLTRVNKVLGYVPIVSFEEGLERTAKWVEEFDISSLRLSV